MRLGLIDQDEVRRRLSFARCIPAMREAMIDLSAGRTQQPLRQIIPIADRGLFGLMPGVLAGGGFGAKLLSVFPGNVSRGGQSHQGLVVLFDPETGAPVAVAHAGEITAIRTAAASAAATDALARADATRLAILGSGEQARRHAEAICVVRPIREIRLWGRNPEHAAHAAEELAERLDCRVSVAPCVDVAVAEADIICTTTAAQQPILISRQTPDGAHVNVVGSSYAGPVEIDTALVARSRFFADHRESVLAQGAEFRNARSEGLVDDAHIVGEIGDVFAGRIAGRRSPGEVTLYKSLGNIVQDLAAASLLLSMLQAEGALRYAEL